MFEVLSTVEPCGGNSSKTNNHTIQFESPSHTNVLLCGLNALRSKNHLVDVTLIAGLQSFKAHRVVLASCSDYFRAMFTTEVRESRQKEITLEGVSAKGMHFLLDYAYTSRLALNFENIEDVLSAASHLLVSTIVEACSEYLQAQTDLENCVDIVTLAETYSLHQLKKRVYRFICGHLMEFSHTPDFQRLSASQLEYLLSCDYPVDCPESDVLAIILQWIEFSSDRIPYAPLLLSKIQFQEIPPKMLAQMWDYSILPYISSHSHPLYKIISSQINNCDTLALKSPSLVNSRGMELAIIKVGGFGINGITNEVTYWMPSVGRWKHLTKIPHVEQSNFGIAIMNNQLYVVGGCFNQCLQENVHPFGFCYMPQFSKWITISPMLQERTRFTLNVIEEAVAGKQTLIAVGGSSENEDAAHSVEIYEPKNDCWSFVAPLPRNGRTQHAGASYNHFLYISGGLEQDLVTPSNSLLRYNSRLNEWEAKANMLTSRADHSMIVFKEKLYICGGWTNDEATGNRFLVTSIDEYDIPNDRWTVTTHVPTPRYHAGITIKNDMLYIVGGFHADFDMFADRTTGMIECYDFDKREWSTVEKYPEDIWEHGVTTLFIPKYREDMDVNVISNIRNS